VSRGEAIVVGAGIVGAACAEALAADGWGVRLLERDFPGAGATAAAMGHLVVMDDSEAQFALTSYSRRLWTERAPELPRYCEDERCGTLWIAADEEEMALVRAKEVFYRARGVEAEAVDGDRLARIEPSLSPGLAGALRVPGDRVIYPPGAARRLATAAVSAGATLVTGVEVDRLEPRRARAGARTFEADLVVNTAGAAAPRLMPDLPIQPRKGHLVITDRHPGFVRHQLVELGYLKSAHGTSRESVAMNLQPRATGQVLIGSSREYVGFDASLNTSLVRRMLGRAGQYVPGLRRLSALRTWVGFRPATPDALPLVGEWEEGLWVAAGHEGLGITTALGTARLLADLVAGRPPAIDPAPFAPRRAIVPHG
jgi:glycine/D-amino acid oxidase-like deaminating enzyme